MATEGIHFKADLRGKFAIVTGASAGIGEQIARQLATAGARLLLVARRQDRLDALALEFGKDTLVLALDMADPNAPQALFDFAYAETGPVDILVNNAGILRVGGIDDFNLAELRQITAVNFESIVCTSYLFGRAMKAAGSGQIINISSIGAHVTASVMAIYGGLKRALEAVTEGLRIELAGSGVKVGLVAPGTTRTEIFDDMKAHGHTGWDEYLTPLEPEDISRAVLFIATQSIRSNIARVHVYSAAELS